MELGAKSKSREWSARKRFLSLFQNTVKWSIRCPSLRVEQKLFPSRELPEVALGNDDSLFKELGEAPVSRPPTRFNQRGRRFTTAESG